MSVPFREAFTDVSSGSPKVLSSAYLDSGEHPVIDQGEKRIAGFTNDDDMLSRVELPVVLFGDHTRRFKYVDQPFAVGADGVKILGPSANLHPLYGYYYLKSIELPSAGYSRHFKFLKEIRVPLPPIPEQRRIAAILDQVDELRAKRRSALTLLDELADSIFIDMFGSHRAHETDGLLETCVAYSGGTPSKGRAEYWDGDLPWFSPKDMKASDLFDAKDHVNPSVLEMTTLRLIPADTVAIVVRGMILAHTFPVARLRVPCTINQDMKALIPRTPTDPAFLAHAIRAQAADVLGAVSASGHGTKRLDTSALQAIRIPRVSEAEQRTFRSAIDKTETSRADAAMAVGVADELFASLQHRAFRGEL